jgi:hypothetical protein
MIIAAAVFGLTIGAAHAQEKKKSAIRKIAA